MKVQTRAKVEPKSQRLKRKHNLPRLTLLGQDLLNHLARDGAVLEQRLSMPRNNFVVVVGDKEIYFDGRVVYGLKKHGLLNEQQGRQRKVKRWTLSDVGKSLAV